MLVAALLLFQSLALAHDHDNGLSQADDCQICLQLATAVGAVNTQNGVAELFVLAAHVDQLPLFFSSSQRFYSPEARGPPGFIS